MVGKPPPHLRSDSFLGDMSDLSWRADDCFSISVAGSSFSTSLWFPFKVNENEGFFSPLLRAEVLLFLCAFPLFYFCEGRKPFSFLTLPCR